MTSKQTSRPTLPHNIVLPILFGLSAFVLLFTCINNGTIGNELVIRYLAGHVVSKVTTALFLVGMASLLFIVWDVIRQKQLLSRITLQTDDRETTGKTDLTPSTTEALQRCLEKHSGKRRRTYFWRRLYTALDFVQRNGNADGLDEELKYAAELDQDEKHDRYSFTRILVWAIPMLGFLGTVLGISEALGGLEIGEDNNFQEMMAGLRSSLYVAFDTTAIALTFAILLMFTMFAVDRSEGALLTKVEVRTREELSQHWEITNQAKDSYVQAVEAIGEQVIESTGELVNRQVKLWRANIDAAESAWVDSVNSAHQSVQQNLEHVLVASTGQLGNQLRETIQKSDEAVGRRWEQWQVALSENARLLVTHQQQLLEYSKNMNRALESIGSLADTKKAIADYLDNVPLSSEYSDASEKLATAVRLLEFRLNQLDTAEKRSNDVDEEGPGSAQVRNAA